MGDKKGNLKAVNGGKESTTVANCAAESCKAKEQTFSFCAEHFDQFKFGLIKKDGKTVPDYEKKFDHYQAFRARQRTGQKAA